MAPEGLSERQKSYVEALQRELAQTRRDGNHDRADVLRNELARLGVLKEPVDVTTFDSTTEDIRIICPDCGKECKTKSGLGAHQRAKHGGP